ncbi:MAG: hypothetical protein P9L92_14835 [Candidatus Electryonea clarkiae]|nr:hypothetical protein [Candidatus Electryonea clarkiae]MDP8286232.1 hypothetical protein [Candidatus Electryonea clarkiae]
MSEETFTLRLGDLVKNGLANNIGIHHYDSGISVCSDTRIGRNLRTVGIYYICPHGRCCSHKEARDNWCPQCHDEHESAQVLAKSA